MGQTSSDLRSPAEKSSARGTPPTAPTNRGRRGLSTININRLAAQSPKNSALLDGVVPPALSSAIHYSELNRVQEGPRATRNHLQHNEIIREFPTSVPATQKTAFDDHQNGLPCPSASGEADIQHAAEQNPKEASEIAQGLTNKSGQEYIPVMPTVLRYQGTDARYVSIMGSFSSWRPLPMIKSKDEFYVLLELPVGMHYYTFVIDGQDTGPDPKQELVSQEGERYNIVEVRSDPACWLYTSAEEPWPSALSSDTGWSQEGQEFEVTKKSPALLPPHLRYTPLNTQPAFQRLKDRNLSSSLSSDEAHEKPLSGLKSSENSQQGSGPNSPAGKKNELQTLSEEDTQYELNSKEKLNHKVELTSLTSNGDIQWKTDKIQVGLSISSSQPSNVKTSCAINMSSRLEHPPSGVLREKSPPSANSSSRSSPEAIHEKPPATSEPSSLKPTESNFVYPIPLHVTINHVYFQKFQGHVAVGSTIRVRDKYCNIVYYLPSSDKATAKSLKVQKNHSKDEKESHGQRSRAV